MLKVEELTAEEMISVIRAAMMFRNKHARLVKDLIASTPNAIAPSGSDIFRPELWKGIHWQWYLKARLSHLGQGYLDN